MRKVSYITGDIVNSIVGAIVLESFTSGMLKGSLETNKLYFMSILCT